MGGSVNTHEQSAYAEAERRRSSHSLSEFAERWAGFTNRRLQPGGLRRMSTATATTGMLPPRPRPETPHSKPARSTSLPRNRRPRLQPQLRSRRATALPRRLRSKFFKLFRPIAPGTNVTVSSEGNRTTAYTPEAAFPARPVDAQKSEVAAIRTEAKAAPTELTDGSLLERFVVAHDQAAFTTLVQRYERLVPQVCRRVLGDSHAAQDAFQLTFMVLARKADVLDQQNAPPVGFTRSCTISPRDWRGVAAQQRKVEVARGQQQILPEVDDIGIDLESRELRQAREELERLPEKYRTPLIMCYLDGRTHDEAAREIGLPRGSMAKRLAEGLERLRERLLNRGFTSERIRLGVNDERDSR